MLVVNRSSFLIRTLTRCNTFAHFSRSRKQRKHLKNMVRDNTRHDPTGKRGQENYARTHHPKPSPEYLDFVKNDLAEAEKDGEELWDLLNPYQDFSVLSKRIKSRSKLAPVELNNLLSGSNELENRSGTANALSRTIIEEIRQGETPSEQALVKLEQLEKLSSHSAATVCATISVAQQMIKEGNLDQAFNMVQEKIVDRDKVITSTGVAALLDGCVVSKQSTRGINLYDALRNKFTFPNDKHVYRAMAALYAQTHNNGYPARKFLDRYEFDCPHLVEVTLADTNDPSQVRELQAIRDVYNNTIMACARDKDTWQLSFDVYDRFKYTKLPPDSVTLTNLMRACATHGDISKAEELWADLTEDQGVIPDVFAYTSLLYVYAVRLRMDKSKKPRKNKGHPNPHLRPKMYNEAVNLVRQLELLPDDAYFSEDFKKFDSGIPGFKTIEELAEEEKDREVIRRLEIKEFGRPVSDEIKVLKTKFFQHVMPPLVNPGFDNEFIPYDEEAEVFAMSPAYDKIQENANKIMKIPEDVDLVTGGERMELIEGHSFGKDELEDLENAEFEKILAAQTKKPDMDLFEAVDKLEQKYTNAKGEIDHDFFQEALSLKLEEYLIDEPGADYGVEEDDLTLIEAEPKLHDNLPKDTLKLANMIFEHALNTDGLKPTAPMVNVHLRCYTNSLSIHRAEAIFRESFKKYDLEPTAYSYLAMIQMYSKLKRMDSALKVYHEGAYLLEGHKDLLGAATGALVKGYAEQKRFKEAIDMVKIMRSKKLNILESHVRILREKTSNLKIPVEFGLIPDNPEPWRDMRIVKQDLKTIKSNKLMRRRFDQVTNFVIRKS